MCQVFTCLATIHKLALQKLAIFEVHQAGRKSTLTLALLVHMHQRYLPIFSTVQQADDSLQGHAVRGVFVRDAGSCVSAALTEARRL